MYCCQCDIHSEVATVVKHPNHCHYLQCNPANQSTDCICWLMPMLPYLTLSFGQFSLKVLHVYNKHAFFGSRVLGQIMSTWQGVFKSALLNFTQWKAWWLVWKYGMECRRL